jgi:hypothetical protein
LRPKLNGATVVNSISNIQPNHIYEVNEAGRNLPNSATPARIEPIYKDITDLLDHVHTDDPFDAARQPLLPALEQAGPRFSWCDFMTMGGRI